MQHDATRELMLPFAAKMGLTAGPVTGYKAHSNVSLHKDPRVHGLPHLHDCGDLGGHHRQHLHLNTIELIQAGPGACLREASKHLASHLEVDAIAAVEHDDIASQCFAKVLQRKASDVGSH